MPATPVRVSIQGYEGSFHQLAAQQFFGKDATVITCATFREVVRVAASKKESDGGVMAIENSIAGSILPNYNLLQKSNLRVVGEIYLQIRQHLLVNPGVKLEDIREVHSHHMALLQCIDYLEKHPGWKLVETEDTALSAKHLQVHRIICLVVSAVADGHENRQADRQRREGHVKRRRRSKLPARQIYEGL